MEEGNSQNGSTRSLTTAHKAMLQVFMSKQVMSDEEFDNTIEQLKVAYDLRKNRAIDCFKLFQNQI
jgi:hypothetical protein